MRIVSYNIFGIRNNSAINKLVIVRIRLDQPETELSIHANGIV